MFDVDFHNLYKWLWGLQFPNLYSEDLWVVVRCTKFLFKRSLGECQCHDWLLHLKHSSALG